MLKSILKKSASNESDTPQGNSHSLYRIEECIGLILGTNTIARDLRSSSCQIRYGAKVVEGSFTANILNRQIVYAPFEQMLATSGNAFCRTSTAASFSFILILFFL
jgi:hypothetical protein